MPVIRSTAPQPVRTLWFGMRCAFTQAALAGALAAGGRIAPVAVVLPRRPRPAAAGWPLPPVDRWLAARGIAVVEIESLGGGDRERLLQLTEAEGIVLGVGACLPWRVPRALRAALPGGVLNIHPSLLPALRGADPVFHAYRLGLETTGISVHQMDAGWDSGPILVQEPAPVPDTMRADAFEAQLAHRGGELLAAVAAPWLAGTLSPRPQDDSAASWAPVPAPADRLIPPSLTVAQARRFLIACGPLLATDADTGRAVPVDAVAAAGEPAVRVRCRDGELRLRQAPAERVPPGTLSG